MWCVWFSFRACTGSRKNENSAVKSCMRVLLFKSHQAERSVMADTVHLATFVVSVRVCEHMC